MAIETQQPTTMAVFLFTDLEGSTRLWQQFPQAMGPALARHDALLQAAVEACNGRVVKTTGDGLHAVFGSVLDAVCACIDAQKSLQAEAWGETGPLRVRMGLHMGEAQQRGGDFFGTAVNRAARLMAAAHGGQVLLSAPAANLVADHLPAGASLRDLGEHRLKDLQRPEHVFQLVAAGLPADFPAIVSLNQMPNNLPSQPTVFVGRQTELNDLRNLLLAETVHLVTLTGPGGTGKTRLALQTGAEVSERFVDGTYFVDLAPIREADAVPAAISRTIGLSETRERPLLEEMKQQLQEKRMLLLLDNFEQVTGAAPDVAELMQYCPRMKLLATSREALHVRGEHLYPVPPLALPKVNGNRPAPQELARTEAVQLFVARAQAVRPGFELTEENAGAIAQLCLRLDGLPLAIELAAARIRIFSPQALQERLGSRLKLLQGGARDLPQRHQTLRDTIGWSYELLTPGEKTLFALLAVFAGGTLGAVEAVADDIAPLQASGLDVVEGIISLADKSLVRLSEDDQNGAGEPRLHMLETIREYATERLDADPALHEAACRGHASYFAAFAQQQWQRMTGAERDAAMADLASDLENVRIAWRFWVNEGALAPLQKIVDALWLLYDRRGWYQAMVELSTDLLAVLARTPSSPEQAEQEILLQTSLARALLATKGYTPEAEQAYRRALTLSERHGQIPRLFPVLRGLASYYLYRGEYDKGVQMGARILALAESENDDNMRLHGYLVLGVNTGFLKGFPEGLPLLDRGIALVESDQRGLRPFQLGNYPGVVCYTSSAFFLWWLGFADRALERAERAKELAARLNHPFTMAYALYHTAAFHLWRSELALAEEQVRSLGKVAQEHGFQIWDSLAAILQGALLTARGAGEEGLARIEEGFSSYHDLQSPPVFYPQLMGIRALAHAQAGRHSATMELIDGFISMTGLQRVLLEAPELPLLKAELLARSPGTSAEAERLLRQLLAVSQQTGAKMMALRAAMGLCRLERAEGRVGEGCRALREVYGAFTEGFSTADLQQAGAILGEIGG